MLTETNISDINTLRGGGVLVGKWCCLFFNPLISLYIYYDQCENYGEKIKLIIFPVVRFHEIGGHLGFYGTHQGTYNFRTASPNGVKNCTHTHAHTYDI